MKAFIRKLSIRERRGFVNSIIYTIFSFLHIILTKTILYNSNISFITILFISGSLLIIMSCYRIFRLMKKIKSSKKENLRINFQVGLNSFISYFCLLAAIDSTTLTNIIFISRLYPFLIMINRSISSPERETIHNHQLINFFVYIFSFLFIFFPALYIDSGFGVVFCLISVIFKFSSCNYLSEAKSINVDLLMLNVGFFNAFFGGIIVLMTFDEVDHIGKLMWLLIILNTLISYFMKIFMNKVLKGGSNEQKLMILNVLALFLILPFDFYVFGQKFYYNYLIIVFSFVEIFFFYKKVKKVIKSDAIYP